MKYAKMSDLIYPGSKWRHCTKTETVYNTDTGQIYFCTKQTVPDDLDMASVNESARNGFDPFSGKVSRPDDVPSPPASDKCDEDLFERLRKSGPHGLGLTVDLGKGSKKVVLTDPEEIAIFLREVERLKLEVSSFDAPEQVKANLKTIVEQGLPTELPHELPTESQVVEEQQKPVSVDV
jgi:hypothetical protein